MKKILLTAIVFIALLTSCRKSYQCECQTTTYYNGVPTTNTSVNYYDGMSRKKATSACAAQATGALGRTCSLKN